MEKIRLKMNYRGHCVYVDIDDTDRCLLIDVINDLYDEALKMKVPLPNHHTLGYSFKMNSIELLDDKGLIEMFSRFEGEKVIDIWIGCGATPSRVLQLARNLREVQEKEKEKEFVEIEDMWPSNHGRKKLEVRRNLVRDDVVTVIPSQNSIISPRKVGSNSPEQVMSPMRIVRRGELFENVIIDNESPTSNELISHNAMIRRSPRFLLTSNKNPKAKAPAATQTVDEQPLFKLSKSTAKLKGVYVPKVKSTSSQVVESSRLGTRRKRLDHEVHHDFEDDSGTDNSYIPTDEEDDFMGLEEGKQVWKVSKQDKFPPAKA